MVEFKEKLIIEFSKKKITVSTSFSKLLFIKKREKKSILDYVDRFDRYCTQYKRAIESKEEWKQLDAIVLRDTLIDGLTTRHLKLIVK